MSDDAAEAQWALTTARSRKRRAALGPILNQSDDDLTMLSTVYPADLAAAEAFIRDAAGQVGVDLFRAEREG